MTKARVCKAKRSTKETQIEVAVNIDGTGVYNISTGIGFLDHMIEQLSKHSLMDLEVNAKGDIHIDYHHTTEDSGYAIGDAIQTALGARVGIVRYGNAKVPMDETLSEVSLDISGRPYLSWHVTFPNSKVGDMDTELFKEWMAVKECGSLRMQMKLKKVLISFKMKQEWHLIIQKFMLKNLLRMVVILKFKYYLINLEIIFI